MQTTAKPLPMIPGGWGEREIVIGSSRFRLTLPAKPDAFLDDAGVRAAHDRSGYMPYWPYLWPASFPMGEAILRTDWPPGAAALEIGAGIGLVGLAALARGLRVTFSDYCDDAVNLAMHNARQNGYENFEGIILDWREPLSTRFPVILGCDVVYETANHRPILGLLDMMLAPGGTCWLGDGGRQHGGAFWRLARERGWNVGLRNARGEPLDEPIVGEFQLMTLARN